MRLAHGLLGAAPQPEDPVLFLFACSSETFVTPPEDPVLTSLAARHGADGLAVERAWTDELGTAHVHVEQTLHDIPVFGAEAIVHRDAAGDVTSITDDLLDDVHVDTEPTLSREHAISLANGRSASLVVLRRERDHLAWRVVVEEAHARPVRFVDAHDGELVWEYDDLRTGTGTSEWYGAITFPTLRQDGRWYLEDAERGVGTFTFARSTSGISALTDSDDTWGVTRREGIDAHFAAAKSVEYLDTAFGRRGIDGEGGPATAPSATGSGDVLAVGVQYSEDWVNAAWTGSAVVIGSGDGETSGPLTSIDIVGHELVHGLTQHTADLVYAGEPGALNESMSDCFGAMIERFALGDSDEVWKIGEAPWTPEVSDDALRYMDDPTLDGSSRDHWEDRYTGAADNGGVHTNSGIGNLAFYLVAMGGTHPRWGGDPMEGIGPDAAAAVWYRALTTYMTASTDYAGARSATVTAAADLYGEREVAAVERAWELVGVGGEVEPPPSCPTGYAAWAGTLADEGEVAWVPAVEGYTTTSAGTHAATLTGPEGTDFDLYLEREEGDAWTSVARSNGGSSTEALAYEGAAGTWRLRIDAWGGDGAWTVCLARP